MFSLAKWQVWWCQLYFPAAEGTAALGTGDVLDDNCAQVRQKSCSNARLPAYLWTGNAVSGYIYIDATNIHNTVPNHS